MNQYLFSYAYLMNGIWMFDATVFEHRFCDEKVLVAAHRNAVERVKQAAKLSGIADPVVTALTPIAVSKLDAPRMTITESKKK